jgi:hypothetical protein
MQTLIQELLQLAEENGIYEPVTDAQLAVKNKSLRKRGGMLKRLPNGTLQVVTDKDTLEQ